MALLVCLVHLKRFLSDIFSCVYVYRFPQRVSWVTYLIGKQGMYINYIDILWVKSKHGTNTLRYKGAELYNMLPDVLKGTSMINNMPFYNQCGRLVHQRCDVWVYSIDIILHPGTNLHVNDLWLGGIRVGHCVPVAGFCLSLYRLDIVIVLLFNWK